MKQFLILRTMLEMDIVLDQSTIAHRETDVIKNYKKHLSGGIEYLQINWQL